jgi:dihydrodipicolinate synthase/N-acetylneuraminate lyase
MAAELRGAFAAAVTPLCHGGSRIDEDGVGPLVDFLVGAGIDGVLTCGSAGEGVALSVSERETVLQRFLEASNGRLTVFAHCGAQTTADTVALAAHAAEAGADGVSVIAPPYFPLDGIALQRHFAAAAAACAPLPFFIYAFAARSGYPVPVETIAALREQSPNLAGLKVSEAPWERFSPYLLEGLSIFVGPEALIVRGLASGAVGAISALATALPELVVRAVREPSEEAAEAVGAARKTIEQFPMPAALKAVLRLRGVTIEPDVRAPLRELEPAELAALRTAVEPYLAAGARP